MHLESVTLLKEKFPSRKHYPFNLKSFRQTREIAFSTPVTFFVGENGAGKSTLLEAMAHKCGIHIWENATEARVNVNPFEKQLFRCLAVRWTNGHVPGAFFSGEKFRDFSRNLEEWSVYDPGQLAYFGGKSLLTQSHGQSLMSYFKSRYGRKGLYLLDEPETALSPGSQLELLKILMTIGGNGPAQFVIASHSPILLGCPGAALYNFDGTTIAPITYEETGHYRIYRDFMAARETVLAAISSGDDGGASAGRTACLAKAN